MPFLSIELYEHCLLATQTIRLQGGPDAIMTWAPAVDGSVHPALCPTCTAKLPSAYESPLFLCHSPKFDVSVSLDGLFLFSSNAQKVVNQLTSCVWLPVAKGYCVLDPRELPDFTVNVSESGLRFEGPCADCGTDQETLFGLELSASGRPAAKPLTGVHSNAPISKTDVELGAGFSRHPSLYMSECGLSTLQEQSISGVMEIAWR